MKRKCQSGTAAAVPPREHHRSSTQRCVRWGRYIHEQSRALPPTPTHTYPPPPPSPQCPPPHRTAQNPTQNFSPRCGIDPETLPSSFLLFLSPPHTPLFHPPALSFAVGISFGAFSHRPGSVRLPPPISPPLHPLLYRGRDASERRNSGTFRF